MEEEEAEKEMEEWDGRNERNKDRIGNTGEGRWGRREDG